MLLIVTSIWCGGWNRPSFRQWYRDDDSIPGANPQAAGADEQSRYPHEGEAQLAGAEHLADVWLNVHILEVLVRVGVVEP